MEQTRIVIINKPGSDSISVYNNNPHAGKEELLVMMSAHIAYFISNMSLENVPLSDAVEMVEVALRLAVNNLTDNEKGAE